MYTRGAAMSFWGLNFFGFLKQFVKDIALLVTGKMGVGNLASDEVQIFVLMLIGISCAMVGTFLVLRKMVMVANSISHTVLIGVVLSYILFHRVGGVLVVDMKILVFASFISSLLTLVLTDVLNRLLKLQKDASIGLVFTFLFALGIVLVTAFTRNTHIGTEVIMGNIDMVHPDDLKVALFLCVSNALLIFLFFKEYLFTAFDPHFAKLSKISNFAFTYLLMLQTSATVIGGLRAIGVVLILALLVVPPLIARMYTRRVLPMMLLAALISSVSAIVAVALSRHCLTVYGLALSTSGLLVTVQFVFWGVSLLITRRWKEKSLPDRVGILQEEASS